ncbi:MAG: helix-turn-helix domain-containing protein [Deltaproteobacteria bacterium]|nr:helix-turn-helix domain-containing protein [Deltaproteobacteria bacterium]MBN2844657.1 helix-turn-helix domain-containing protein [Deltaproteobacteria bacterium]
MQIIKSVENVVLSTNDTCKLLNISRSTLSEWVSEGFPKHGRGKYPLLESVRWFKDNRVGSKTMDTTLIEERRLKLMAERKLKELELLLRQGELMFREDVKNEFVARIHVLKRDLLNIPKQMKPGSEERMFVEKRLRQLMENYSRPSGVLKKAMGKMGKV